MSIIMATKGKIIGYGILISLIWLMTLFISGLFSGTDAGTTVDSLPFVIDNVVSGAILAAFACLFARRLKIDSSQDAIIVGIIWTIILVLFVLLIALPNGTIDKVFGGWSPYLPYIGVFIGPLIEPRFIKYIPRVKKPAV